MDTVRIYADADGESYFEDVPLDLATPFGGSSQNASGASSELWPTSAVQFRHVDQLDSGLHTAGQRQLVIFLQGAAEIEVSSGERRVIGAGVIQLVEDTTGRGHTAKKVSEEPLQMMIIRLA